MARYVDLSTNYLFRVATHIRSRLEQVTSLPSGDVDRLLMMYAVLVLAKGPAISVEDVHNGWTAWMSFEDPAHSALVPFDRLDDTTAASDLPFVEVLRQVANELGVDPCHGER